MDKPTWAIHYVQEHYCECCGKHSHDDTVSGFDGFVNAHTHGLNFYSHDEICVVLDIGPELVGTILNDIGFRIREEHEQFIEGKYGSIIEDYDVMFYRSNGSKTLYLLFPDPDGRFPGDPGCQHPYDKQKFYADIIEQDKE
jgi:hypothetical protein